MANNRSKRLLGNGCMLLAPIGAMKLAAWWLAPGSHLANANAYAPVAQIAPIAMPTAAVPSAQELEKRAAAEAYATSMQAEGFGPTPFYYEPQVKTSVGPVLIPTVEGAPAFTVQVIMSSESETKALINGKIYRMGDEFEAGWIVADIDGIARTVTIADPRTSRSATQAVRMPGER